MAEMLNSLVISKPEKPVDFLIELLGKKPAPRFCVVTPPGFPVASVTENILKEYNVVLVSLAPLVEAARARIIDGLTVAEHEEKGPVPDYIVVKLIAERLSKPDCIEKGWLLEGVPLTRGQSQQLVAAGHVPDKVVHFTSPDDTIIKAVTVPESETQKEDLLARKKELAAQLPSYRWEVSKALELFNHIARTYEVKDPATVTTEGQYDWKQVLGFLGEQPADAGLKDITGA